MEKLNSLYHKVICKDCGEEDILYSVYDILLPYQCIKCFKKEREVKKCDNINY